MNTILADIVSLAQYLKILREDPDRCRLEYCCHCGRAGPWHHGCYTRKADRSKTPSSSLNPVPILRFFCPDCHRTSSVLPECVPPRRWYLWDCQQAIFLSVLMGKSVYAIVQSVLPSRHTLYRWLQRFHEQFQAHQAVLHSHTVCFNQSPCFSDFWQAVLKIFSLGQAMRLCHVAGVFIP